MTTLATKMQYTPEDLLTMPDGDSYELVNGELVERNMSYWSSFIGSIISYLLNAYCFESKRGWVAASDASFQCFPDDPQKVRRADVSFIRLDRLTSAMATAKGHMPLAPDLAVEVVSPGDLYYEVDAKTEEWLAAGVQLVWIVNPRNRTVTIRRADGTSTVLHENDELTGESVIPGFRCRVSELFLLPTDTPTTV